MLKALAKREDGRQIVTLGLSYENVKRLLDDDPIVFHISSAGIQMDAVVVISYVHDDGKCKVPLSNQRQFLISLSEEALRKLSTSTVETSELLRFSMDDEIGFVLFADVDEQTMYQKLRRFMGTETKVTYQGFPPSDIPVNPN